MEKIIRIVLLSIIVVFVSTNDAEAFTEVDGGNETQVVDGWVNNVSGSTLYVGKTTSGNAVHVINGGKVYDRQAIFGTTYQTVSHNNSAWVAGTGSAWHNQYLDLGHNGSDGNQLVIELEGRVYCSDWLQIGSYNGHNNRVTVQDSGSLLTAGSKFEIGYRGNNNSLSVLNGGVVSSTASLLLGKGAENNEVVVSGEDSELSVSGEYTQMVVGPIYNSISSTGNHLLIEDGGHVVCPTGIIGLSDGGSSGTAADNGVTVSGSNSIWNLSEALRIGHYGVVDGNWLLIEGGGAVNSDTAEIGTSSYIALNNHVTVTGEGSVWNNAGNVVIGNKQGNNGLSIQDSGSVYLKTIQLISFYDPTRDYLSISEGLLSAERILMNSYAHLALTNAVLQWRSPTEGASFMSLGGPEHLAGTNEIQIAVSSRSGMQNRSLDLLSGLDDPADTNHFEVLFLDTSSDQLYRPEGATYTFESGTWSITTDGNTEFVPTPPVPILSIEVSGGNVNIDVQYLPEGTAMYLQASTNLISGSWSNLYETSGETSTNWSLPVPVDPATYYRMWSD